MARATRGQKTLIIGLLTIALLAPPVFLDMIGRGQLSAPFVYGGIIALIGAFYGLRLAFLLSLAAGAASFVAALLNPYAIAGAIFFGLLTFTAALAARRGLHSPALMVPLFVSFMLVAPSKVEGASDAVNAVLIGLVFTVGGLWAAGAARLLMGSSLPKVDTMPIDWRTTITYASLMGVIVGIAAWGVLTWARFHEGAWLILTIIVVLQPTPKDTLARSFQRLGGTVIGGVAALVLIALGLRSTTALIVAGIGLFLALTVRYVLHRPYWEYIAVLTPAVILLDSNDLDQKAIAADRVGFTLAGGAIAILVAVIVKAIALRRAPSDEPA